MIKIDFKHDLRQETIKTKNLFWIKKSPPEIETYIQRLISISTRANFKENEFLPQTLIF